MANTGEVLEERMNEFPLEVLKPFVLAANHVLETVVYTLWNPQEMRQKWRKRALSTILTDGDVNHLYPCVDTAILATAYLLSSGLNPRFRFVTDKGALDEYREGKSQNVHIDSWVELKYGGRLYGMDIGCGDLTFVKPIEPESHEQQPIYTTRFEPHSQTWFRTDVLLLDGKVILENPDTPILNFLGSTHNLVQVPFGLTLRDYHTPKAVQGEESVLDTNQEYDLLGCQEFTQKWTADFNDYILQRCDRESMHDFPKLIPIRYK